MYWKVQKKIIWWLYFVLLHCEVHLFCSNVYDEGTASIFKVTALTQLDDEVSEQTKYTMWC